MGHFATIKLSYTEGGVSQTVESGALPYSFTSTGYTTATIFTGNGRPISALNPDDYFGLSSDNRPYVTNQSFLALLDETASASTALVGRYKNGTGSWTTWSAPPGAFVGETVVADQNWAQIMDRQLGDLPPHSVMDPLTQYCFNHRVDFRDEPAYSAGQEEAYRSQDGTFPARFARVVLWSTNDKANMLSTDYLDGNGCIGIPSTIDPGRYTLWILGRAKSGTTETKAFDHPGPDYVYQYSYDGPPDPQQAVHSSDYPIVYGISFRVFQTDALPAVLNGMAPTVGSYVSNLAATYGQALYSTDSGLLANHVYTGYANEQCPGLDSSNGDRRLEACYSEVANSFFPDDPPQALYLGPGYKTSGSGSPLDPANHTSLSKFVIAHEMGHEMQYSQWGGPALQYDRLSLKPQPAQLCGCSGLNPTGNEIHCMQSTEQQTAAQVEAYAHAFAANVWNSRADNHCTFTYYKGFRYGTGGSQVLPPTNLQSCDGSNRYQTRWTESYCPLTDRASEYDWLAVYTTIFRATTGGWSQADLANVYKDACSFGSFDGKCHCDTLNDPRCHYTSYNSALRPAAQARFGGGSAKFLEFVNAADTFGVTR